MAGTQSHPIEYPNHPDPGRMTCSQPVKGSNRGCPAWQRCQEKTKGRFPVNVFAVDAMGQAVVVNHCEQWYMQLRDMVDANQRRRFTRVPRPEKLRVKLAKGKLGTGEPMTTQVVEVESPPLELRGEWGSGCYMGESPENLDMLGPELRKQLGLGEDDDTKMSFGEVDVPIETGTGVKGAPILVDDVLRAAGHDPLPAS